jgi:hypothetical protein
VTPAALRILKELDAGADLIRDGIHAYCGDRQVASRVVSELILCAGIRESVPGMKYYDITEMGRRFIRRPELANEYVTWVRCGRGPFTIKDDRIVPLK